MTILGSMMRTVIAGVNLNNLKANHNGHTSLQVNK